MEGRLVVLGCVPCRVSKRQYPVSQLAAESDTLIPTRSAERGTRPRAHLAGKPGDVPRVVEEPTDAILERCRQIARDLIHGQLLARDNSSPTVSSRRRKASTHSMACSGVSATRTPGDPTMAAPQRVLRTTA